MPRRWTQRPEHSTWGDWGDDDELGRLNLLTPQKVREGIAEVQHGISFCLSLPLDVPGGRVLNPRRSPPTLSPVSDENGERFNQQASALNPRYTDVFSDDKVELCMQYSTQWDSLAHVGSEFDVLGTGEPVPVYYNGWRAGSDIAGPVEDASHDGRRHRSFAHRLGIDKMAFKAVQGRGVLVDLAHHLGRANEVVDLAKLQAVMEADSVVVEPGDMLLLHTGFATAVLEMNLHPDAEEIHSICPVLDGTDPRLLDWLTDSQVSVLVADNFAVERLHDDGSDESRHAFLPIHHHCLFRLGMNLGEMWYLHELAAWLRAHDRSRFLLTAPPLRMPGAVGSPATPVATV